MSIEYRIIQKGYRKLRIYADGRIYSEAFTDKYGRRRRGRFLAQSLNTHGYRFVHLGACGIFRVARLVAEAWLEGCLDGMEVDHIDGDRTNNHVGNLRIVSGAENRQAYKAKRKHASSNFRGVFWDKVPGKWRAWTFVDGRRQYHGSHDSERDAALARDKAILERSGELSQLNLQASEAACQ